MQEQVIFQIGVFAEPSVTYVTLKRPRSVMHVHMRFQVAGSRERFGAQCTFVRFFLRIRNGILIRLAKHIISIQSMYDALVFRDMTYYFRVSRRL